MELVRKFRALLRSSGEILLMVPRRCWLRVLGVRFGRGLRLEGSVDVGTGQNVRLGRGVKLGRGVLLGAWPGGELVVGNDTYIGQNAIILAHQLVTIGNDCLIAPGSHITDVNHGIAAGELIRKQPLESKPVNIGNDVWVGAGCSILPGVTIGDGAVIGARAVVTKDIPSNAIAVGISAKVLRYRLPEEPREHPTREHNNVPRETD